MLNEKLEDRELRDFVESEELTSERAHHHEGRQVRRCNREQEDDAEQQQNPADEAVRRDVLHPFDEVGEVSRPLPRPHDRRHGDGGEQGDTDHGRHDVDEEDRHDGCRRVENSRGGGRQQGHHRLNRSQQSVDPHEVLRRHQLRHHRRDGRTLDAGTRRADRERQVDQPERVDARQHEEREGESRGRDRCIRGDDEHLAVEAIGPHPAEDRDDSLRQEAEQRRERHHRSRLGFEGQVPHHRVLHEHRAEQRDRLTREEDADIPFPMRAGFDVAHD